MIENQCFLHKDGTNSDLLSFQVMEKINYWKGFFNDDVDKLNSCLLSGMGEKAEVLASLSLVESGDVYNSEEITIESMEVESFVLEKLQSITNNYKISHNNTVLFEPFFDPYLMFVIFELETKVPKSLLNNLITQLRETLFDISYQTLILELNVMRLNDELLGETSEERYQYFCHQILRNKDFLTNFYNEYPVLFRLLCKKTYYWTKNIKEMFSRLERDKLVIEERLGITDFSIKDILLGLGDSHNKGQMVATILFTNGKKILYKPRSHSIDTHFLHLLQWLNQKRNIVPMKIINVIDKENYGWVEFIEYKSCNNESEIKDYYTRLGQLLALLYTINAVDFHHENLIANGSEPILIDLESIFHQHKRNENIGDTAVEKANYILSRSVNSTGILPFNIYYGKKYNQPGVDISGMGGKEKQLSPIKGLLIKDVFTDNMRLEKESFFIDESQNIPKLFEEKVDIVQYLPYIENGFTNSYTEIMENRNEFLLEVNKFQKVKVRNIIKATMQYSSLLRKSYHPDFLRNEIDRMVFLCRISLHSDFYDKHIARYEVQELADGDIPYFQSVIDSQGLWNSQEEILSSYYEQSALTLVHSKLDSLSNEDLADQLHVIRMSILAAYNAQHDKEVVVMDEIEEYVLHDKEEKILSLATGIGNYLVDKSITSAGKQDVTWISTLIEGSEEISWTISPTTLDLYNGNAGIAFFMSYLALLPSPYQREYKEIVDRNVNTLIRALEEYKNQDNEFLKHTDVGAFTGISGYLYSLHHISVNQNDPSLMDHIYNTLPLIEELIQYDESYDIIAGSAGCLMVMMALFEETKDEAFLSVARSCVNHLLKNSTLIKENVLAWREPYEGKFHTGFAHGTSGIATALARYNKVAEDKKVNHVISSALNYDRLHFVKSEGNWNSPERKNFSVAWCHGAAGILLSRVMINNHSHYDPLIASEIDIARNTLIEKGIGNNRSLCHGDFGQLDILKYIHSTQDNQLNTANIINKVENKLITLLNNENPIGSGSARGVEAVGLMIGLSGIGYGLLQTYRKLPSILALDPPLPVN